MQQLKFQHKFAQDIIAGKKHSTLRIDNHNIRVGQVVRLIDKTSTNKPQQWLVPGELHVIGVQEFVLNRVPRELLEQAEVDIRDAGSLYDFLRRFYGDYINGDTIVKIIDFDYKPYKTPLRYLEEEMPLEDSTFKHVILYADGGSRGNPGPSAAGYVVEDVDGHVIKSWNKYLGITTNNQAEYHAMIAGLEWALQQGVRVLEVRLDSLLVVNQMKGVYKVKNRDLWTLYEAAKNLRSSFKRITFSHVPRELNRLADAEVNKALDSMEEKDLLQ